jgi:uncharacterized protein
MNCPKCPNTQLTQESVESVTFDRCPSCHGMWLDVFALEKLLALDPRPLLEEDHRFEVATRDAGPRVNCPRCKGTYLIKLNSRIRPGTIVDNCKTCFGTWLDAGELSRLAHADWPGWLRALFA